MLAQTAESPSAVFNLCIADDTSFKDVEISVMFKAVKGKLNQGGAGFCGDCDWPQQVQAPVHQFFRRESATLCGSQPVDDPPHPCVLHIAQLVGNEVHPLHQ